MSAKIENIIPTDGYALVEPVEETKTKGIALPDSVTLQTFTGKVLALGASLPDSPEPKFKKGDTIIHRKYGGEEFSLDMGDKVYLFVKFDDILGIIK